MTSFYIIQSGNTTKLETDFTPNLELNGSYEIALHSLETYYSFANVDEKNNRLKVSLDSGASWNKITFAVGSYEHKAINDELQRMIVALGGKKDDVVLKANRNTFQSVLIISGSVQLDLSGDRSIRNILGFEAKIFKKGRHLSKHTVNIMRINSIFLHTDVISSTYLNGVQAPVLYSFYPECAPGMKIIIQQKVLIYLPISINVISRLTSWLTGQDLELLDLRGETLTIKYHLRCIQQ